jgi:plastocyanin
MVTARVVLLGLSLLPLPDNLSARNMTTVAAEQMVELQASEFRFEPEWVTVTPGAIRFVVHNIGELRHVLTVKWEGGLGGASIRISPGQTQALAVTLEQPGSYSFFCPLEDEGEWGSLIVHRDKGMEGQLIVAKE